MWRSAHQRRVRIPVGTSVGLRMSLVTGQATDVMIPYASLQDSLKDNVRLLATFRRLSRYVEPPGQQ